MESIGQCPWVTAAIIAAILSLIFGAVFQQVALGVKQKNPLGYFLGMFESVIFMAAFAFASVIGAGWLGFKVASKWKSWSLFAEGDDAEAKEMRTVQEISRQYRTFLVGTAGNIVIGLVAYAIGIALGGQPRP